MTLRYTIFQLQNQHYAQTNYLYFPFSATHKTLDFPGNLFFFKEQ